MRALWVRECMCVCVRVRVINPVTCSLVKKNTAANRSSVKNKERDRWPHCNFAPWWCGANRFSSLHARKHTNCITDDVANHPRMRLMPGLPMSVSSVFSLIFLLPLMSKQTQTATSSGVCSAASVWPLSAAHVHACMSWWPGKGVLCILTSHPSLATSAKTFLSSYSLIFACSPHLERSVSF